MSAKVKSFSDRLPTYLLLETSFIEKSLSPIPGPRSAVHKKCEKFLQRMRNRVKTGRLRLFASPLVIEECIYRIVRVHYERELEQNRDKYEAEIQALKERTPEHKYGWHDLYKDHPELLSGCEDQIWKLNLAMQAIPITILPPEELEAGEGEQPLIEEVKRVVVKSNLLPRDAFHVVTAQRIGADGIVAMDRDFERVDDITVYSGLPRRD